MGQAVRTSHHVGEDWEGAEGAGGETAEIARGESTQESLTSLKSVWVDCASQHVSIPIKETVPKEIFWPQVGPDTGRWKSRQNVIEPSFWRERSAILTASSVLST